MPKFTKNNQEFEAVQHWESMAMYKEPLPRWLMKACLDDTYNMVDGKMHVRVGHENVMLFNGDWIIRDSDGNLSVLDDRLFQANYKPHGDAQGAAV